MTNQIKETPKKEAPKDQTPQSQAVQKFQESTIDNVLRRVAQFQTMGDLRLPENYSPENAVRSAWLLLQETKDRNEKPVLESCTKESIANALLDMVLKGLSPVKKQCYFIAYGNKLSCDESYFGTIAIAKREADVKDVNSNIVYEGDVFEYSIDAKTGVKSVIKHEQSIDNIDMEKIKGGYSIIEFNDGSFKCEIMTMKQIRKAWEQGAMKGNSPAHKNFPDQMCLKTIVNRGLKIDINSSDDSALYKGDPVSAHVKNQISQNANKQQIGFNESNGGDEKKNGNGNEGHDQEQEENLLVDEPAGQQEESQNIQSTQSTIGGPGF